MKKILAAVLATTLPCTAALADTATTLSTGVDYSAGDYGTGIDGFTWTIPVSLKHERDRWTFKASLPWVRTGDVNRDTGTSLPNQTQSGVGDLVVNTTYALLEPSGRSWGLDLGVKLKFATADKSKTLLTTGKNDYSVFADVFLLSGDWSPFFTLGWTTKGDPVIAGVKTDFRNPLFGSAGISYRPTKPASVGISYDWRQRLLRSSDPVSEATLFYVRRLDRQWKVQVYGVAGFSDASPDWGLGSLVGYTF